jgi:hypothetical protein
LKGHKTSVVLLTATIAGVFLGVLAVVGEGVSRALTLFANLAAPWALAALIIGRRARSSRDGAIAGGLTLVVGMLTWRVAFFAPAPALYLHGVVRDIIWTIVALIIGPTMGICGAVTARHKLRRLPIAVVAPAAVILGETLWRVAVERKVWRWDLQLEPYRWNDLLVFGVLGVVALLLPLLIRTPASLMRTYLLVLVFAVVTAFGMSALYWFLLNV